MWAMPTKLVRALASLALLMPGEVEGEGEKDLGTTAAGESTNLEGKRVRKEREWREGTRI